MRRISIAGSVCASVLLIACTGEASPTSSQVDSEQTESLSPSASVSPSVAPTVLPSEGTATGERLHGFAWNDILRVEANGLAVRVAPYTHLPLATGWTWDGAAYRSIGELRLHAGDFVSVDLGPVQIGDTTWYRVWPAEGGQVHHSTVNWDTKNDGGDSFEPGWVAASVGADAYLTCTRRSTPIPVPPACPGHYWFQDR